MKKTILLTLFALSALVFAQESGPPQFTTLTRLFNRQSTASGARDVIGAASSGSGGALTNAVIYGSTSGNVTFGATGSFIGTGTANGLNVVTPATELHVGSTSTSSPRGIMSAQYSTDALGARLYIRKARGTEASPLTVAASDVLGDLSFEGYDSANYLRMASIRAEVPSSATVAATRVPTQIVFSTATDATPSVLTDRLTLTTTGQLLLSDGTAALPGLSWASDPDTGFYKEADNRIALSAGAGTRLYFTTTSIQVPNGTASGPSYTFANASSTGMWFPSAGNLAFSVTGTEMARFTTAGLGINTTVPGSFGLAINHATGQSLDLIYNDSDGSPANHATLVVSSGGNLTIAPSGGSTFVTGTFETTSTLTVPASGYIRWSGLSRIRSSSDGIITFLDNATTSFDRLQLGGTTSSFPAIKRSTTTLAFRLADDSADASISASNGTFSGYIVGGVQSLSGAGAVNVTQAITEVTTTGAAQALTLADGVAGQEKTIIHGVDGGSAVLTPTTKTGWSTATFTSAGESLTLVFLATRGWCVKSSYLAVVAP